MTLSARIRLTLIAIPLSVLSLTVAALYSLNQVGEELVTATGRTADTLARAGELKAIANGMRTGQRGLLLNRIQKDDKGFKKTHQDYEKRRLGAQEQLAALRQLLTTQESQNLLTALEGHIAKHVECFRRISELCLEDKLDEASVLYRDHGAPAGVAMEKAAEGLTQLQKDIMKAGADRGARRMSQARWIVLGIDAFALIVLGALLVAAHRASRVLRKLIAGVMERADRIRRATRQVAAVSQSLAQGATEQAASIEETSASTEEILSMTRSNLDSSHRAASVMGSVDERVAQGNQALDHMVTSMKEITASSGKISRIIQVIDEIAFQTNILALNAAVEAARAGEAGAGFAVVADEVRNLAHRSAQAAKDTAGLIEESIERSNAGGTRMTEVAAVIRAITESSATVRTAVEEVRAGSDDQAKGIERVARAIVQMQQVTQNAAASAEESASASEEIAAQAQGLNEMMDELSELAGLGRP